MGLIAELRRRNVIRVAGLYLVAAWLVAQVAGTLLPIFDTPGWVLKVLIVLLALGFVPAVVVAWVFELTPEGFRRERDAPQAERAVDSTARKLDVAVIVLLLAIGGMMLWNARRPAEPTPAATPLAAEAVPTAAPDARPVVPAPHEKSIAVLPFADFSQGGDQSWFADGLSEEILNALARTPDLQVAARTSSFRYKGSALAIPQIAAELGVRHVLEGSVRSTPQRIRVTAQLVRAADGFHLWSQNYDRDVADMIEIQEDLATQIATAMQTSMDPKALSAMAEVGTRSVEAYQAYMRGVAKALSLEPVDFIAAYELFERARALDPGFAAAHARGANFWLQQLDPTSTVSGLTDATFVDMGRSFGERIDLAIRHASNETDRTRYRATKAARELRVREAISLYQAYIAERPGDSDAIAELLALAAMIRDEALLRTTLDAVWPSVTQSLGMASAHINYAHRAADRRRAADEALVVAQRWFDQRPILYQAHRALLWDGRVDAAREVLARMDALSGADHLWSLIPRARQACAEGRRADTEALLEATPATDLSQRWHLLMLLGRTEEANALLHALERDGNVFALAGFLAYRQFDPTPFPSLTAMLEREQAPQPPPLALPFACPPPVTAR